MVRCSKSPVAYTLTKQPAWSLIEQLVYIFLCSLGIVLVGAFALWWFQPSHIANNFSGWLHGIDIVLFFLLTYVVWYQIANELFTWWIGLSMKHPVPTEPEAGLKVALATAFVPGKEPYEVLERALQAMQLVTYPHHTWVLDEGNDAIVKKLCRQYKAKHFSRYGIAAYNTADGHFKAKTKAGNYNAWFDAQGHKYDIIAQHDVDFAPAPHFLERTLGYFKDPTVAFVGTPQIYGNINESWIAKAAAEQAYGFYGPIQKGLFGQDMQLFIGANHVFRTSAHDSIGGYSGHIVEDHLTGMRLYAQRWKSVFVPEVLLVGEGPATWDAYFSQQMRWAYGLIDILFRFTPRLITQMRFKHALYYILLQQYYFFGVAQFLGLLLIGTYFAFGLAIADIDLVILLIFYPLFVIMQIVITLWLQRAYINWEIESGLHLYGKFLNVVVWPIYLLALLSALIGRTITYQVTPKGAAQTKTAAHLGLFTTQIVVGSLAGIIILSAFYTGRLDAYLLFWVLIVFVIMYGTVLAVQTQRLFGYISSLVFRVPPTSLRFWQTAVIPTVTGLVAVIGVGGVLVAALSPSDRAVITHAFGLSTPEAPVVAVPPKTLALNTLPEPAAPTVAEPTTTVIRHVVSEGEYLRAIADTYYGDEDRWYEINYAGDPDLIHPGEVLLVTPSTQP